jgi:hypothetical protein
MDASEVSGVETSCLEAGKAGGDTEMVSLSCCAHVDVHRVRCGWSIPRLVWLDNILSTVLDSSCLPKKEEG